MIPEHHSPFNPSLKYFPTASSWQSVINEYSNNSDEDD
jgi:hypothetical protein